MSSIKGLCIGSSEGVYEFTFDGTEPEEGLSYLLESSTEGTLAQNGLFHSLVSEYWSSSRGSREDTKYDKFRDNIKRHLGVGFDGFWYFEIIEKDGRYLPKKTFVKKKEDIPEEIRNDPYRADLIYGRLKSWSNYTLPQRKKTIDHLITEMLKSGCNSKKFNEILKGINYEII